MRRMLRWLLGAAAVAALLYYRHDLGEVRVDAFGYLVEMRLATLAIALLLIGWLAGLARGTARAVREPARRSARRRAVRAFADGKWGRVLALLGAGRDDKDDPLAQYFRGCARQAEGDSANADRTWKKLAGSAKRAARLKAKATRSLEG